MPVFNKGSANFTSRLTALFDISRKKVHIRTQRVFFLSNSVFKFISWKTQNLVTGHINPAFFSYMPVNVSGRNNYAVSVFFIHSEKRAAHKTNVTWKRFIYKTKVLCVFQIFLLQKIKMSPAKAVASCMPI